MCPIETGRYREQSREASELRFQLLSHSHAADAECASVEALLRSVGQAMARLSGAAWAGLSSLQHQGRATAIAVQVGLKEGWWMGESETDPGK